MSTYAKDAELRPNYNELFTSCRLTRPHSFHMRALANVQKSANRSEDTSLPIGAKAQFTNCLFVYFEACSFLKVRE